MLLLTTATEGTDCPGTLTHEGATSSAALRRFRELIATRPTEAEGDAGAVLAWHELLLDRMRRIFEAQGVVTEPYLFDDGHEGLRVVEVRGRSPLNDFAGEVGSRLGISFVYSPRHMIRAVDDHVSRAKFNRHRRLVFLSHGIVDGPHADDSLHHEVLHATFEVNRRQRIDSLFGGRLKAVASDEPMWDDNSYGRRVSFEELATYPLNLSLLARQLEAESGTAEPDRDRRMALLRRMASKARILRSLAGHIGEALDEIGARLARKKKRKKLHLRFEREWLSGAGGAVGPEVVCARLRHGNQGLEVPFVDEASLALDDKALRLRLRERLERLAALAHRLRTEATAVRSAIRAARTALDEGTLSDEDLRRVLAAARAPRESTLPFLERAR